MTLSEPSERLQDTGSITVLVSSSSVPIRHRVPGEQASNRDKAVWFAMAGPGEKAAIGRIMFGIEACTPSPGSRLKRGSQGTFWGALIRDDVGT
ncbi:hypothetical protein Cob_v006726 [Colletotrichum orbiculare MAFF 240422]|uniref:Uncharacterized protein n=1 Tax=Colletotrichum orbiculare (strain 104-T / ATCC 96160 / CBS 514.97 / LARS 414 / MAFF 240422) TaxID=1213857 RepID=A0A484FR51_COLOR|nr:hypothetical protein Cob_v006726 [Colletotrichum orbiculare MAFF 240422]